MCGRSLAWLGVAVTAIVVALALVLGGPKSTDAELAARVAELYAHDRAAFATAPEITVAALSARLAGPSPPVLVDVREPREMAVSRLPGTITRAEFEAHPDQFRGRAIVAYCTIGYRSGRYVETLRRDGWDAFNLAGSLLAWIHAGRPMVDAEGKPTHRVHVYAWRWNLAPAGYDTVW
jgi:rhodanese-related sulfurtransferase